VEVDRCPLWEDRKDFDAVEAEATSTDSSKQIQDKSMLMLKGKSRADYTVTAATNLSVAYAARIANYLNTDPAIVRYSFCHYHFWRVWPWFRTIYFIVDDIA